MPSDETIMEMTDRVLAASGLDPRCEHEREGWPCGQHAVLTSLDDELLYCRRHWEEL